VNKALHQKIETIESGYEFLLAYAAQGRESDAGLEVRKTLEMMLAAITAIADDLEPGDFAAVVADDARKSRAAVSLVLGQEKIAADVPIEDVLLELALRDASQGHLVWKNLSIRAEQVK